MHLVAQQRVVEDEESGERVEDEKVRHSECSLGKCLVAAVVAFIAAGCRRRHRRRRGDGDQLSTVQRRRQAIQKEARVEQRRYDEHGHKAAQDVERADEHVDDQAEHGDPEVDANLGRATFSSILTMILFKQHSFKV